MVTKKDLEVAIAAYGLGRILPAGSTRAAARAVVGAVTRGGKVIAPPVARGAVGVTRAAVGGLAGVARRNPGVLAGLTVAEAYRQGVFDSQIEALQGAAATTPDLIRDVAAESIETVGFGPDVPPTIVPLRKPRKVTKYQKAVKAGMAAVKKSKFGGKPGKLTNAKKAFATVNKVASAVNKGKKVAKTGIKGVAAKAIRRIL